MTYEGAWDEQFNRELAEGDNAEDGDEGSGDDGPKV